MTLKEAHDLLEKKYPGESFPYGKEYDGMFIFDHVPKNSDPNHVYWNDLISIDKKTSRIGVFIPIGRPDFFNIPMIKF